MKHTSRTEHVREDEGGPVSLIRHRISSLVHGVVEVGGATMEIGGELGAGAIKVAGRGVRGFVRKLFR